MFSASPVARSPSPSATLRRRAYCRLRVRSHQGAASGVLRQAGQVFYTVPSDHYNCPVGSYTHNIALPSEREADWTETLGLMVESGYIKMEEVPGLPRLPKTPAVTVYAPLSQTPVAPDVVLVAGIPAKLMLLHEAAIRAAKTVLPLLGRPTCMAIPAALSGGVASSLGCIGNRVYTGLADDQFYTVVAGSDLKRHRRRTRHDRVGKRETGRVSPGTASGASRRRKALDSGLQALAFGSRKRDPEGRALIPGRFSRSRSRHTSDHPEEDRSAARR